MSACRKLAFRTPEAAERTATIMRAQGFTTGRRGTPPARLYLCPKCDLWHWTSQSRSRDGAPSVEVVIPDPPLPVPVAEPPKSVKAPKPPRPPPPPAKPSTTRQQSKIRELEARNAALVGLVTAIKEHLRPAAAALCVDPTPGAVLTAICAMDAVVCLPRTALDNPARDLAAGAEAKREWLTAQRASGAKGGGR